MKLNISRSAAVDVAGKAMTYVRFDFDGHDAGTLEVPWEAWRVWNKALIAGCAASLTPYEQVVSGFTLPGYEPAKPVPSSNLPNAAMIAQLPKLDAPLETPDFVDELGESFGQREIARLAQIAQTSRGR